MVDPQEVEIQFRKPSEQRRFEEHKLKIGSEEELLQGENQLKVKVGSEEELI